MSSSSGLLGETHTETIQNTETIVAVSLASASCCLSLLGSSLILGTYYFYPQIRKPARNLLFWLSVTDLGTALSYGMTFIQCGGTCQCAPDLQEVYTLLGIYFPVCSFLWTDCIGLYIYAATYQKTWIAPRERLFRIFHLICWGLPMLTILSIIILKALHIPHPIRLGGSATGGWCWIQQWQWDLLGGKVIEIFSYVFLMVVYVLTWKELKRVNYQRSYYGGSSHQKHSPTPRTYINPTPSSSHPPASITNSQQGIGTSMLRDSRAEDMRKQLTLQHKSEAVNRLLFIPVVFFFLRIWGTIHMFMDVSHTGDKGEKDVLRVMDQTLAFFQALCDPLQGFCNGILFVVFVSEVRQHLFNTLSEYIDYKWLDCCGLICCCHYCFSCCCHKCHECFECCLVTNQKYYRNTDKVMIHKVNTFNNQVPNGGTGTSPLNTDYFAAKYQFLPNTLKNHDRKSDHTSPSKSRSLVCKEEENENNYNSMINATQPTIQSPSISSK